MENSNKKVLLIKLSSLGDVIFNLPLANCLKKNGYEVSWLVSEKGITVLENNPCVDKVFLAPFEKWKKSKNLLQNYREFFEIIKSLRKEKFDIALDTQMRLKSLFFTKFCGAKRRVISKDGKEFSKFGANEFIQSIKSNNLCHSVKGYLRYAEYLGLNTNEIELTLPEFDDKTISQTDKLLQAVDLSKPMVVVAPATTWKGKHWDKDCWKELIEKIEDKYSLVFTGMASDEDLVDYIGGNRHINLVGKTSLKVMIEILRRANLLISLDSGTTHLGWATQVPKILSIFCCTPKELYAPLGNDNKYISIQSSICKPCHHKKCPNAEKYICTKSPSVDEVIAALDKLMVD